MLCSVIAPVSLLRVSLSSWKGRSGVNCVGIQNDSENAYRVGLAGEDPLGDVEVWYAGKPFLLHVLHRHPRCFTLSLE